MCTSPVVVVVLSVDDDWLAPIQVLGEPNGEMTDTGAGDKAVDVTAAAAAGAALTDTRTAPSLLCDVGVVAVTLACGGCGDGV